MALASRGLRDGAEGVGPMEEAEALRMRRCAARIALISAVTAALLSVALLAL